MFHHTGHISGHPGAVQVGADILLDLMTLAWPEGVPDEELAIVSGLDSKRRELAKSRLGAMLAYEREKSGWQPHVGPDLSRAMFFTLLRAWRKRRSLASIVPRVRPHSTWTQSGDDVRAIVKSVVAASPGATRSDLTKKVRKRLAEPPAASTLAGLIDAAKAEQERRSLGGAKGFGSLVVVDASPVTMPIAGDKDVELAMAWAGFVVDAATGTPIAAAAATLPHSAIATASRRAADRLAAVKVSGEARPKVEIYLRGEAKQRLLDGGRLKVHESNDGALMDVRYPTGRRSEGSRIATMMGRRFGPVTLSPRLEVPIADLRTAAEVMPRIEMIDARIDAEANRKFTEAVKDGSSMAIDVRRLVEALRVVPS
jgi:hypothetical protein